MLYFPFSETTPSKLARFPILTLDEAKLTPALGYVFDKKWIDPRESLVSILWKLKVANALSGVAVMRLVRLDIDP